MAELLSIVGVSKAYRRGERRLRVLSDLSLTVGTGEIVAIVGARFEGKSTLLRVAAGFELPDAGNVVFEGTAIERLSEREREQLRPSRIAWASREGSALDLQVLDYVSMSLILAGRKPRDAQDAARAMLERVTASDVARLRWSELSNWERVLVSLARAAITTPRLLVIDDLLDGLGLSKTEQAGDLFRSLVESPGSGVLMSVSDMDAALAADRIYSFERGRLQLLAGSEGSPGQLVAFPRGRAEL